MPTPVAHSLAGAALGLAATRKPPLDRRLLGATVLAACLADIDFGIGFLLGRNVHHYFTHSLGFTILFSAAVYAVARWVRRPRPASAAVAREGYGAVNPVFVALLLGAAYLSHLALDLLSQDTAAPYGLELFWPLSGEFYISPVLVFDDIWRGTLGKLFGLHNWLAVLREVLVTGPLLALVLWWRRAVLRH